MRYLRLTVAKLIVFLHEYPALALGTLLCLGTLIILLNFFHLSQQVNYELAMQYASLLTRTLEKVREEYTTQVTDRVKSTVLVTDDYQKHEFAIPFPATFGINLADKISEAGRMARIYSDFPFPSRTNGGPRDAYEVAALTALRHDPDTPFVRIEEVEGRRALRFAQAIRLEPECVGCHNARLDSPKTGWQPGDVRGVQELTMPLDMVLGSTVKGLIHTLGVMMAMAMTGVGLLALVVNKLRTSLRTVETMAHETEAANHRLCATNVAYDRFVPHEFLSFLHKESITDVQLGDHVQQEMTILFSDIRSFTTVSERMTPEENFQFINTYLGTMGPIVRDYHGFIDKYIGDGIMALFLRAEDAVDASIAMLQTLLQCNHSHLFRRDVPLKIGIGLNTGCLMLGTIGEHNRMEGTVISDAVNLSSRTEGLTKLYGASLLITQHTFQQLQAPEQYLIRVIDRVKVKGKAETVVVYEVCDGDPPDLRDHKAATKADFEAAIGLYQHRAFAAAKVLFEACGQCYPRDQAVEIYIKRCTFYLQNGYDTDWDGVTQLDVK
jgi:class 3 adenylate cyclase